MSHSSDDPALLRAKLNSETARLPWAELQRHFARGVVIRVAPGMDLVQVAGAFAADEREAVAAWLGDGRVAKVGDAEARRWQEAGAVLWAVVVAPWVLVQEMAS